MRTYAFPPCSPLPALRPTATPAHRKGDDVGRAAGGSVPVYGTSYNLRSDHTPLSEMVRRQKWGGGSRQLHNVDEDYANHPNRSVLATPPPSLASPSRASSSSSLWTGPSAGGGFGGATYLYVTRL